MSEIRQVAALEADGLGKHYRRGWALKDCRFALPTGRVSALVGPNGAGKSTLMTLSTGLLSPTTGEIRVFGDRSGSRGMHSSLSFLAQNGPLFPRFTVGEMLDVGKAMNAQWDGAYARTLVDQANVPLAARVMTLSSGQRTRVALALAMGRRPQLIMLDEPLADLDPLARQEVMRTLMQEVAETGMTVLISSHVLNDLDEVCDHMLLLANSRIQISGDVSELLSSHRLLIGPSSAGPPDLLEGYVIETRTVQRQTTVLCRGRGLRVEPGWESLDPTLEELVLSYLRASRDTDPSVLDGVAS